MEAFNGDEYLEKEFIHLIDKFHIQTICETGSYLGQTTKRLSEICRNVVTIEIREDFYVQAKNKLIGCHNVEMHLGDAPKVLDEILPNILQPLMIFLDSHWGYPTPLKGEFEAIAKHGRPAVICIHDMKNPDDPTMKYDTYDDQEYTLEAIKPYIELVYGKNYKYYFNKEATGARVGALFITAE